MWKKVFVLVEGQTEEKFVRDVLEPYFYSFEILLIPTVITTKENLKGKNYKGGVGKYENIRKNLLLLLNNSNARLITTFFDYYAFPVDIPGYEDLSRINSDCYERVEQLEKLIFKDIKNNIGFIKAKKLLPFIALHEFETYLFVSPEETASAFPDSRGLKDFISKIKMKYQSPEEINDGKNTHPSKRLEKIIPDYNKKAAVSALLSVSLNEIRTQCPHFDKWIKQLESIKND